MIKRFPSRNQRSKGIKVKHVLQIILLLGVCFWLIYQIKHNHDKKKEFDENDAKRSVRTQTDQILKLGRKDLHPGKDEVNLNDKHEEEEEDENVVGDEENKHEHDEQEERNKRETEESEDNKQKVRDQEEEENKHGAEEQEEDENKSEEMEDEGRGGGDDEIDENEQEKSEVEADRDEEPMDEEKEEEGDEKENENSEDEEKGGLVENHNTHEAREEHYKGDDASSAVAQDTHTISTETETFNLENSDVNLEMNITKPENETTYSDESDRNQNDSELKDTDGELTDRTSSNATAGKEIGSDSLSNPVNSTYLNKTVITNSDSHLEATNNLTPVTPEANNNLTGVSADTSNSSSSEQNKIVMLSEADHAQNATVNTAVTGEVKNIPTEGLEQSGNRVSEEHLPGTDSTASVKTEHGDSGTGQSSNLGATELEKTIKIVASKETENRSRNSDRNDSSDTSESDKSKVDTEASETNETQNIDATEDEMFKGDIQTGETGETSDSSSANGTSDSAEHDAIDSSDSHIHEDVTEVGTDLGTLPDIRNEGDNEDETASE